MVDDFLVSYNVVVCCVVFVVVNVYNCVFNSISYNQLMFGLGVIMDQCGYILINKYVINDVDQIIVVLQDGCVFEVLLVGFDFFIDFVVFKINVIGGLLVILINLKCMLYIGDVVLVIGNFYNLGQIIIQGIISVIGCIGFNLIGCQNFLQIDVLINYGNFGGVLVNFFGELMGINIFFFDKSNDGEMLEGIGFVILFQLVIKIMDKLICDGWVICGYIGISGWEIVLLYVQGGGIDQIQGIVVNDVVLDGLVV